MKQIRTYKEPRWVKLRERVLKRDKYIDQYLYRYGKVKQAELVHHIFPVNDFPEYQYEEWNLISITKKTHEKFHIKETQLLSKTGLELLIRTAKRNNIEVPNWYIYKQKKGSNIVNNRYGGLYDKK